MARIIHCADLHLASDEAAYSLAVLDEIVALAASADFLLVAGDLFDSFADLERMKGELRGRLAALPPRCRAIVIPGNHEHLRMGGASLASVDLGPGIFALERPFARFEGAGVEILAIPFAESYADYLEWPVPPKGARARIVMAHGTLASELFAGVPDGEEPGGVFDADLFARLGCDYAALGHIHAARSETSGALTLSYPGSARVWRRGETGPRTVCSIEVRPDVPRLELSTIALASAGEYREHEVPLNLDGSLPDLSAIAEGWRPADWVRLLVSGVINDEHAARGLERALEATYGGRVRRIELDRERVLAFDGISSEPIARKFIELWAAEEPATNGAEREIWLKAREIGLLKIKDALERRA